MHAHEFMTFSPIIRAKRSIISIERIFQTGYNFLVENLNRSNVWGKKIWKRRRKYKREIDNAR